MGSSAANSFLSRLQQATYDRLGLKPTIYDGQWLSSLLDRSHSDAAFEIAFGDEPEKAKARIQGQWNQLNELMQSEKMAPTLRHALASIPSSYENPFHYQILLRLQTKIENTIDAMLRGGTIERGSAKITIGTLPTGDVNARSILVPSSSEEFLVLFDSQMFNFANLLSKAVSSIMTPTECNGQHAFSARPADILQFIETKPDAAHRFGEAITAYLVLGTLQTVAPYVLEEERRFMAALLLDGLELFAMAHEYGHIVKGHFAARDQTDKTDISGVPVTEYLQNWDQEFAADIFAAQVSPLTLREEGYHQYLSFLGVDFFFVCALFIERGLNILTKGTDEPFGMPNSEQEKSHPPAGMRMLMVERAMKRGFPQEHYQAIVATRDLLMNAIELLWRTTVVPGLMRLHQDNVRPSKMWLDFLRRNQN